jgi:hypothetical protein
MIIIEKIFDIQTGEETVIEREETADEQKSRLEHEAFFAQEQAEAEAKATAKAALLAQLGITEEQASLLLS